MGGNGRLLLTALTATAGGNVTGSAGAFLQAAAVNTLQGLATQQVKLIADSLESETARTALHAVLAGAAARGEDITSAALGASASVVLHNLVKVAYEQDEQDSLSLEQREACKNLVTTLIAGTTAALGGDTAVATTAATIETENNAVFIPVVFGIIYLADKAYTTYQIYQDVTAYRNGEKSLEQIALERGEEYLTGILVGNLAKYGYKVAKVGGKWVARVFKEGVKHRDEFATATACGAGSSAAYFSKGTGKAAKNPTMPKAQDACSSKKPHSDGFEQPRGPADASQRGGKISVTEKSAATGSTIPHTVEASTAARKVGEKVVFPGDQSKLGHIFRNTPGHVTDTAVNRKLILEVANDPKNFVSVDQHGNNWAAKILSDGRQCWVQTRGGKVINAGVNSPPRNANPLTGLSSDTPLKGKK